MTIIGAKKGMGIVHYILILLVLFLIDTLNLNPYYFQKPKGRGELEETLIRWLAGYISRADVH